MAAKRPPHWIGCLTSSPIKEGRRIHETFLKVVADKSKCSYDETSALLRKVAKITGHRPI